MTKMAGYKNSQSVPTIGTAGHIVGIKVMGSSQESDLEKIKRVLNKVCPVNKNIPTKMLESSFVASCLKFRAIAEKDRDRKNKAAITTPTGFRSSNKGTCLKCKRGLKISKGMPFDPPTNMTFAYLEDIPEREEVIIKPRKKRKRRKWGAEPKKQIQAEPKSKPDNHKLFPKDVLKIRKLFDGGKKVAQIHKLFPHVGYEAVSRVAHRRTFKNI